MAMKIIGGIASGISLSTPATMDVRPTGVRAKKALFDSLTSSLSFTGKTVVDLFSGTGGLGLEAASRGAEKVYLIEKSSSHCRLAEENVAKVIRAGVNAHIESLQADSLSVAGRLINLAGSVDIIFADPPYAKFAFYFKKILSDARFAEWAEGSVMIWEQPPDFKISEDYMDLLWNIDNIRKFAQTSFIFMSPKQN
jgi:16S rRNA (guanine966-N2)-methyltransferase